MIKKCDMMGDDNEISGLRTLAAECKLDEGGDRETDGNNEGTSFFSNLKFRMALRTQANVMRKCRLRRC
jgi:hypothetical protein